MKEKLISVKGLKKYYPLKPSNPFEKKQFVKAVDDIDLEINRGEIFGLVGESGCGKSTTGLLIMNLLDPSDGEIIYQGQHLGNISLSRRKELRKNMQIIFQDPFSSLNPKKRIAWLLEEPLIIHGLYKNAADRKKAVNEMLVTVGLDESFGGRYPHQLSGGQRQRVNIAIALMLKPDFIVADEPVSSLDVSVQAQILNLLKSLQKEFKLTYLFISHDLNVVEYMSDRIGVMYLGKMVEAGPTMDIYENPMHPYTQALVSAIPAISSLSARKRILLDGDLPDRSNTPSGCPFHPRCFKAKPICSELPPVPKKLGNGRIVSCHLI